MDNNNLNEALDWDSTIENDGVMNTILPEGDYNFLVNSFERGSYPGGEKLPACNKATITVQVNAPEGRVTVKFDLFLHRTVEWKLSAFFRCIGQKKPGEKLVMNWGSVIGSKGRAHFKPRSYVGNDGELKQTNELDKFIDYDESFFTAQDDLPF